MKPDWHDRPTEPGLWVGTYKGDTDAVYIRKHNDWRIVVGLPGARWLGPLPPDTKEEK